jgi:hypothetical protein
MVVVIQHRLFRDLEIPDLFTQPCYRRYSFIRIRYYNFLRTRLTKSALQMEGV